MQEEITEKTERGSLQQYKAGEQETMLVSSTRRGSNNIIREKKSYHYKPAQTLEQFAQGGCGNCVLEGFQDPISKRLGWTSS